MNVVDLSFARAIRKNTSGLRLFLVTDRGSDASLTLETPFEALAIFGETELASDKLAADLFIVDCALTWSDPFRLTQRLADQAPVICLAPKRPSRGWSKQAYGSGASDILYPPYDMDEFNQALAILIRLERFA